MATTATSPQQGISLPESIPVQREIASPPAQGSGMGLWLLVLFIGCVLYAAWRKWGGRLARAAQSLPSAELQTRSVKRLTPKHSVHVVAWRGREYLLGCSEHEVTLIASAEVEQAPKEPTP